MFRHAAVLLVILIAATIVRPQATTYAARPLANPPIAAAPRREPPPYVAPSGSALFRNFVFDSIGPYPVFMALATAGIHQATNNPPEWGQGAAALSKRFASNMGVTAVGTGARMGVGALLHEDTSYYRCRCAGVWPRLQHAALSALIARKYGNGDTVFSVAGLVAPYSATMTAVYAWYPSRYSAMDAFRMGNYNLLGTVGSNITFEFLPENVRMVMTRFHLSSRRVSDQP